MAKRHPDLGYRLPETLEDTFSAGGDCPCPSLGKPLAIFSPRRRKYAMARYQPVCLKNPQGGKNE
jgi:hypothetical protein